MCIGFIGQGYVGKNLADYFEGKNKKIIRYSLDNKYIKNVDKLKECEYVFIAVPTPTINGNCDTSNIVESLKHLKPGTVVIIKSTILPNSTINIQQGFTQLKIFYSPEFLRESYAKEDTLNPQRNIIGLPLISPENKKIAKKIMSLLPKSKIQLITDSTTAENIKYLSNAFLLIKNVFMNIAYDSVLVSGGNWNDALIGVTTDSRIGSSQSNIFDNGGRGSGGNCLLKDFEAYTEYLSQKIDRNRQLVLKSIKELNIDLLTNSYKDLDILKKTLRR